MTLYFYADETQCEYNSGKITTKAYGYGVLITRYRVEDTDVIIEALMHLKRDPDIHKLDRKAYDEVTIQREYFHACEDSANAHSHLCTAIRKYIQGKFRYDYDDKSQYSDILSRSCLEFTYRNEPIVFVIEERADFQQSNADIWIENAYKCIEKSLVQSPDTPAYFPEIKIEIKNKKNAGLQVTDFILWAINRTKNKKPEWQNKLKFTSHSSYQKTEHKLFTGGEYILKQDLDENSLYFPYPKSCFPLEDLPNNFLDLVDLYNFIEQQLSQIDCRVIPNHILHLQEKLTNVVNKLNLPNTIHSDYPRLIQEIVSIYIRLFDTFPLYQDLPENNSNQWSRFLLSRKFASQLLFQEDPEVQRFCHELIEYKRNRV